ncbi:MAG: hypothetical protein P8Z30_08645 [Acidobacteriota bacterium]
MNLEQFSAQFVNKRQVARVREGAVLAGVEAWGAGSGFWTEEPARRATAVMIGATSEPDRIMPVSNESPPGPGMESLLMTAGAMLRMPAAGTPNRRQRPRTDGCFAG